MNSLIKFLLLFLVSFAVGWMLADVAKAAEVTDKITNIAAAAGKRYNVDPQLILAIIEVESSFNPSATGKLGEVGLMQLHPKYHQASYNEKENITQGTKVLSRMRLDCPYKATYLWVNCYNRGIKNTLKNPAEFPYYKKVMNAYERNKLNRETADVKKN